MDQKLLENARIVLEASCRAKPGETVLLVADERLLPYAPAFATAAVGMGLLPAIFYISHFLSSRAYDEGRVLEPLKAAMEAADIVIGNTLDVHDPKRADFSRLVGDRDAHDRCLTSERRWVYLQCNGVEKWDITTEAVAKLRERTLWLVDLLRSATSGRIVSQLGTDFTFGLVVDGPTQLDVRPAAETGREPLRITVKAGRVADMSGDPVQIGRLEGFIASGDPAADAVDEVGILTTVFEDNDRYYWSDGTHHHDRVHVALGNNVRRDTVIHGPRHMDAEICKPTISIDGLVIVENGQFLDRVWDGSQGI
jgi:leucyl aminopeptidase (aminopeptidase T)